MLNANRLLLIVLAMALGAALSPLSTGSRALAEPPRLSAGTRASAWYPFGSGEFSVFINDSYRETPSTGLAPFEDWFAASFARAPAGLAANGTRNLQEALTARAATVRAAGNPAERAGRETSAGNWLHGVIKTLIPRFSLERGFEFAYTVKNGERQCLLQSVLIAGLLQRMGIDAGVYMVWRNPGGQESNNGHAVTVIKRADGRDLLIDASERAPIALHQGLFVADGRTGTYRFVTARYDQEGAIIAYAPADGRPYLRPPSVRPLDVTFLRSQFYYYRGEQAPGGFLGKPPTPDGLATSTHFLRLAARINPRNPLPVYVLGHVYRKKGQVDVANTQFAAGYGLYVRYGHVPPGPRAAYAQASR